MKLRTSIIVLIIGLAAGYFLSEPALYWLLGIVNVVGLLNLFFAWLDEETSGRREYLDSAFTNFGYIIVFGFSSLLMVPLAPILDSPEALLKYKDRLLDWLLR